MEYTDAQKVIQNAGYAVHSIEAAKADIGHYKFLVSLSGNSLEQPSTFNASFQSNLGDLEQKWGNKTIEPLFGGEISLEREAEIYSIAREAEIPAPIVQLVDGETPFLLEEVVAGKPLKEYVAALPAEQRESSYLDAVRKIGAVFAKAHAGKFDDYGDVWLSEAPKGVGNAVDNYTKRLHHIVTHNLAWNNHESMFSPAELQKVRAYLKDSLQALNGAQFDEPTFLLANPHRGNVNVNEQGEVVGVSQCNFAQAGVPAAEFYNAFWQFADAAVAPTTKVHAALLEGYHQAGGEFDPAEETNQKVMRVLDANHFLRAATVYASMRDRQDPSKPDLMRNRWGKRFKEEILFPIMEQGTVDYDLFSQIVNEKWKP